MEGRKSVTLTLSKKKRRAFKFAIVLSSVIVGLGISEIVLRVAGYSFPTFYTTDPERGFRLRPNTAGWYRKEGETYISINSAGLRDREHSHEKPGNTLRIAIVGDSYAEAFQVPLEQTFWAVLERGLQSCAPIAGRTIEVLNFGVSGYGTAQELITVERDVFAYSPDIVLLSFTTNNDVSDNSRRLKGTDEIPYFVFREGRLVLDDSFLNTRAFRLRSSLPNRIFTQLRAKSRVLQAFHHAQHAFKNYLARRRSHTGGEKPAGMSQNATQRNTQVARTVNVDEIGIDNLIYRPPTDPEWEEAWRVTEALIVMMRDEVTSHGVKFIVVIGSNGPQVVPDPATRAEIMTRLGSTDIFYPDSRLRALGEREGIPVLALAPELQAYAEQHNVYLHGFGSTIGSGHWNAEGHRVSGESLAQKLCTELSK